MALAAVVAAFAVLLALTPQARALDCEGIDLGDGCLFTITGGDTPEIDDGYAVTNAVGVPMWDFVRDKDAQDIGYPISQRWTDGSFTLQAFQKVILQWDPGKQRMNYYNTLDVLANRHPDVELPFVPAHQVLEADRGADFASITRNHLALLEQNEAIKDRFLSEPDWLNLYGLPISYEEREVDGQAGGVQMLRAQRTVFVVWNVPAPGTTVGRVNLQNVPDKVKKLSNVIIPDAAKVPASRDGRINAAIEEIAWVRDGLGHGEAARVEQLRELATLSPPAFWALVRNRGIHATSAYGRDLEPTYTVGEIIGHIAFIARGSPGAAETVTTMPFLDTFDGLDIFPLRTLLTILWFAPDELEPTVWHLASVGGITDDQRLFVPLIHLRQRHPGAAQAIEALHWIRDGIAPPSLDSEGTPAAMDVEFRHEPWVLIDMLEWQLRGYGGHLETLLSRPWFQDGLDQREYGIVFAMMSEISPNDSQAALRILRMPFLETIGPGDSQISDILYAAAFENVLQKLLSQPALRNGIVDGQLAVVALEYLRLRDPSAAEKVMGLPWIRDGVVAAEEYRLLALQRMALEAPLVFEAAISKSWIADGIDTREVSIVDDLTYIGNKDQQLAVRISGMPFLEDVDAPDVAAVGWLAYFSDQHRRGFLDGVLGHATLAGGIHDEHASLVSALFQGANGLSTSESRRALLATLFNPEKAVAEERTITLPHAGEVVLSVVRLRDTPSNLMHLLERAVRGHEEFMGTAFPVDYVSMVVADIGRSGAGASGSIHIDASSFSDFAAVIAHEVAHIYWAFAPVWLQEGPAVFLEWIALNKEHLPFDFTLGEDSCSSARNLSELESKPVSEIGTHSVCNYSMGFGMFHELYQVLGDAEFRRGFRELFLRLDADTPHFVNSAERLRALDGGFAEPECSGAGRTPCYLRAAFFTSAPNPEVAARAWHVIHRWYYGP